MPTSQGDDAWVGVYDANHQYQWVQAIAGSGTQLFSSIAFDDAGNMCATGSYEGSSTVGSLSLPALGNTDGFLVYFSATGDPLQAIPVSSTGFDTLTAVLANAAAPGCVAGGALNDVATVFVIDGGGNKLWETEMPASGRSSVTALTRSSGGRLFAAGSFEGTIAVAGTTLTSNGSQPDVFVVELDPASGAVISAQSFGGSGVEIADRITATPDGALILLGEFSGTTSIGGAVTTSLGQNDVFFHRIIP
jgi:hypothetical protein